MGIVKYFVHSEKTNNTGNIVLLIVHCKCAQA
jgi:hypothetical protein